MSRQRLGGQLPGLQLPQASYKKRRRKLKLFDLSSNLHRLSNKLQPYSIDSLPSLLRKTRTSILAKRKEKHKNRTPLIITFNSNVNNLQKILTNNTPEILHSNPPLLAYRIKKTLGGFLVKAKYNSTE